MKSLFALCAWALASAVAGEAAAQSGATPVPTPPRCGADHQRLDYMVGNWRIIETESGKDFALNRVERTLGGCGLRENLTMIDGQFGTSAIFFSAEDQLWHLFYHDSTGLHGHLTGVTSAAGRQELISDVRFISDGGRVRKMRQVTDRDAAGRPRQVGYVMNDTESGWRQIFDLTFCPADTTDPRHRSPC